MQDHIGFRCAVSPGEKIEPLASQPPSKKGKKAQKKKVEISEDASLADIVADHPENVARMVRTLLVAAEDQQADEAGQDGQDGLSFVDKIAIFLIELGQLSTAEVMKYLTDREIETISEAVARQGMVPRSVGETVLEEARQLLIAGNYSISYGGIDFARGAL